MADWTPPDRVRQLVDVAAVDTTNRLRRGVKQRTELIRRRHSAEGTLLTGGAHKDIDDAAEAMVKEAAVAFGQTVLDLVTSTSGGALSNEAGQWILSNVESTFEKIRQGLLNDFGELKGTEPRSFKEAIGRGVASALADVALTVGQRELQSAGGSGAPVPLEISEPNEYKIKRWEELLALVKLGHQMADKRWDGIDEKSTRYATLLGVVLAASAIGFGEVGTIVGRQRDSLDAIFVVAYIGVGVSGLVAFVLFVWALRLQTFIGLPLGRELVEHAASHNYVDVLYSVSMRFVESTEDLDRGTARKTSIAAKGYYFLLGALACAIISSGAYIAIKARDQAMSNPRPTPAASAPTPATPSPTSPNPHVSAPAGRPTQKGIEGGSSPKGGGGR